MAIITGTFSAEQGAETILTLVPADLIAIVTDAYWKDAGNWKAVTAVYESLLGQAKVLVQFDINSPYEGKFRPSAKARTAGYRLSKIEIKGNDLNKISIPFGSITGASGFEVAVGVPAPAVSYPFAVDMTNTTFGTYDDAKAGLSGASGNISLLPDGTQIVFGDAGLQNIGAFDLYNDASLATHYVFRSDEYLAINKDTQTISITFDLASITGSFPSLSMSMYVYDQAGTSFVQGTAAFINNASNGHVVQSNSLAGLANIGDVYLAVKNQSSTETFSLSSISIAVIDNP